MAADYAGSLPFETAHLPKPSSSRSRIGLGIAALDSLAVRIGFASIFFANGIAALTQPADFEQMLADNSLIGLFNETVISVLVQFAAINDLLLASALLFWGKRRAVTYLWAAVWLAVIALIKMMNLFG